MKTLVFIPAWNEEGSVGQVVRAIKTELPDVDVLVCDDGSSDDTAQEARAAGALVASFPFHVGIGAAVHSGYLYAARHDYQAAAHCDADGQHTPAELRKLLEAVWAGRADLVIGSRYLDTTAEEGAYRASFSRALGIALFRRLLSWQTGTRFTDTSSGFRAAGRAAIELYAERYASDFPELEALQRAVLGGLHVIELPVHVKPRISGYSKITPLKSAHFVWKSVFTIALGLLPEHGRVREVH